MENELPDLTLQAPLHWDDWSAALRGHKMFPDLFLPVYQIVFSSQSLP